MWSEVLSRISELKSIDTHCVATSGTHRYQFGPKLPDKQIEVHELRLGAKLPEGLRLLYTECGNGGVGPDWGIRPIEELVGYRPHEDFQGLEYYQARSSFDEFAAGMIGFMDRYYDHEACIIANGPDAGGLLEYIPDADCIYYGAADLPTLYHDWLDEKLEQFNRLIIKILKYQDINAVLENNKDPYSTIRTVTSMLDMRFTEREWSRITRDFQPAGLPCHLPPDLAKRLNSKIQEFFSSKEKSALSLTHRRFTHMKFLAVDVDYRGSVGHVAGMTFTDRPGNNINETKTYKTVVNDVADYVSGEFYKRELPCIQALINEHRLTPDCIAIDGFVHIDGGKPGLGKHLFDSLQGKVPVIGIAKNPRGVVDSNYEVFRGRSVKPLFVTCEGMELDLAKNIVKHMKGGFRMPDYIRHVDALSRKV